MRRSPNLLYVGDILAPDELIQVCEARGLPLPAFTRGIFTGPTHPHVRIRSVHPLVTWGYV